MWAPHLNAIELIGVGDNELCKKFITSNAEGQLAVLKQILCTVKENCVHDIVHFLVIAYLNADLKHPVKSMISRYVTRNSFVQSEFCGILTKELEALVTKKHYGLKSYLDLVCKVGSCTENFPVGADAVKNVEILLAECLTDCLSFCGKSSKTVLSPTEKNAIFNLAHSTLRLLLYLIQRVKDDNASKLISMFKGIRTHLNSLIFDADAPMDTKSVCGILYVSMHEMENWPDSWIDILDADKVGYLHDILQNESAKLSLYSAIATVIPAPKLHCMTVSGTPAAVLLTDKILDIGERNSADSTISLGVTRTVLQMCKGLEQTHDVPPRTARLLLDALLPFVWPHLDHHTDSVRHLTAQALAHIVTYCSRRPTEDAVEAAIGELVAALARMPRSKGFYVGVTCVLRAAGAQVLQAWPRLGDELLAALGDQAVQASAASALETLLRSHARCGSDVIIKRWVTPLIAHAVRHELHAAQLSILENLLCFAAKMDPAIMEHILRYIKLVCSLEAQRLHGEMKSVLMLLRVARAAGALRRLAGAAPASARWQGVLDYAVLSMAAVDASQQIRILALSLVVESQKSTEPFTGEELDFVLWFMQYNINSRVPNFRQHVLALVKKLLKRLENSDKVLLRNNGTSDGDDKGHLDYLSFIGKFRSLCYESLVVGANYSRRHVALQVLVWLEDLHVRDYSGSVWTESAVGTLLHHLGDSYETNKALALLLLERTPATFLRDKFPASLDLSAILAEASSVKPTDCATAAYKLQLLRTKMVERQGQDSTMASEVKFGLLRQLLEEAKKQLQVCQQSLVLGARSAPMYGVLHCIASTLEPAEPFGISTECLTEFIDELVTTCVQVCECAGAVLSSAAPEGLLPDVTPDTATCDAAGGHIRLEDGREVTAQMVLLCAWRSVKEVSQILGTLGNQLIVHEEIEPETRRALVERIGKLFTELLTETKHRGAFEQVYVGFTRLLSSLWRTPLPQLNALPKRWLRELMATIECGDVHERLCATRRSAGLPFMIQALVITELQVKVNTKSFDRCMQSLLRVARAAPGLDTRCHCLNTLRALYRSAALDAAVGAHVGAGLVVALLGFDSGAWLERNSATLLFSALMVRVFGVQRSRDAERLCVRNRMTGRIFFLRYPDLYDFMLNKLKEVTKQDNEELLHPSLYPILLLLARLYPSSLEGTVSNLKLSTFVPLVVRCAGSRVLLARRLAASAVLPLVAPTAYISHIESMLELLCNKDIKRNYCHGILLQVLKLLDNRPENLVIDSETQSRWADAVLRCAWLLRAGARRLCYPLADEYLKLLNVLLRRFPSLLDKHIHNILQYVKDLLFKYDESQVDPGRQMCMSHAAYLCTIVLCTYGTYDTIPDTCRFVHDCFTHNVYEVVLAGIDCLLIGYNELDIENEFQQHLAELSHGDPKDADQDPTHLRWTIERFRKDSEHIHVLRDLYFTVHAFANNESKYVEWSQKCLKLIALEADTQMSLIKAKESGNKNFINASNEHLCASEVLVDTLVRYVEQERESLTHVFLLSLCKYVTHRAGHSDFNSASMSSVLRVVFACSLPDNGSQTREVVLQFLECNLKALWKVYLDGLSEEDQFEFKAYLCATMAVALEDEDDELRSRAARVVTLLSQVTEPRVTLSQVSQCRQVTAARAADYLLQLLQRQRHGAALLTVIAMLDFKAEVCMNDEVNDESRVFDHNERYNVNLEETIWARACANAIRSTRCGTPDVHQTDAPNVHSADTPSPASNPADVSSVHRAEASSVQHADPQKVHYANAACVHCIVTSSTYVRTLDALCGHNFTAYVMLDAGQRDDAVAISPKVQLFYDTLRISKTD
ncbi:thyroid adenoma-associated protein homolog isoform X2 [Bicyclus anynana]|uniref:tRNA (32-2'-O)-methyltransferase regulator THADA n=1 Tax=Bicyclus anynana TaxID=110368 RepID=A0ABM3LSB3_BICAN|nr:thyroid adenoma-associated protein homolog isoform X2 [Bicyclus anynana]XP_052741966.1 thyroid adenoma-associated protein homolog isoform X2 [Bicyclus anynana]